MESFATSAQLLVTQKCQTHKVAAFLVDLAVSIVAINKFAEVVKQAFSYSNKPISAMMWQAFQHGASL
jgi:hypothetical protein